MQTHPKSYSRKVFPATPLNYHCKLRLDFARYAGYKELNPTCVQTELTYTPNIEV